VAERQGTSALSWRDRKVGQVLLLHHPRLAEWQRFDPCTASQL